MRVIVGPFEFVTIMMKPISEIIKLTEAYKLVEQNKKKDNKNGKTKNDKH